MPRPELAAFVRRYAASLGDYLLGGPRESGLKTADALGRVAIAVGMGVLDVTAVHGQVLLSFVRSAADLEACERLAARAGEFLSGCMAAFEGVHRGARESCLELGRMNRQLRETALELAAAKERIQRLAAARSAFLAEAARRLSTTLDFDQLLLALAELPVPQLARWCAIELVEPESRALRRAAETSAPGPWREGVAAGNRVPLDAALSAELAGVVAQRASRVLRSGAALLAVPLLARGGVFAVLVLLSARRGGWDGAEIELAEELGRLASAALENARLSREVSEALRVRDQFLSLASHELRTPLTPLLLRLSAAARRSRRGEAIDGAVLESSLRQVQRLSGLVSDLLDIGRIQAGRLELQLEAVPLVALVEEVRTTFCAAHAGRALRLASGREPAMVRGDRARLEQLVTNLVENALKYSAEGSPVDLAVEVQGGCAVLTVRDRGIGIPLEQQQRVFERFFRADNAGAVGDSFGLGLFICREIVERHGGAIWMESEEGLGTAVFVSLPRWAEPAFDRGM